jgi:hypothetical protein
MVYSMFIRQMLCPAYFCNQWLQKFNIVIRGQGPSFFDNIKQHHKIAAYFYLSALVLSNEISLA